MCAYIVEHAHITISVFFAILPNRFKCCNHLLVCDHLLSLLSLSCLDASAIIAPGSRTYDPLLSNSFGIVSQAIFKAVSSCLAHRSSLSDRCL